MPGPQDHEHGAPTTSGSTTDGLVQAARAITLLSSQLDGILLNFVDPPEPDKPVAISAAKTIQAKSAHMTTTANSILARLGVTS